MKITAVKTTLYLYPLKRRMGDANSPGGRVKGAGCLVEVFTDEGLTGIGLGGGGVRPQIHALVEGTLKGEDPRGVRGLWQKMVDKHFKGGHDGLINDAIAVLDTALWDLKAKANGEPLWKTLGGFWAQMDPFAYILPPETAQIHCGATGLALFRRPELAF